MPFWKKTFNKKNAVYYPQAIVQGKPVETETIARDQNPAAMATWTRIRWDKKLSEILCHFAQQERQRRSKSIFEPLRFPGVPLPRISS